MPLLNGKAGNQRSYLRLYGDTAYYHQFQNSPTANRTITLPNAGGTMALLTTVYPVGAIYMSTSTTSPASLFGGTWEQLKGGFIYGGTSFGTGNGTGTSTKSHTLTESQIPSHNHSLNPSTDKDLYENLYITTDGGWTTGSEVGGYGFYAAYLRTSGATGGGQGHSHDVPYIAVLIWKRTA